MVTPIHPKPEILLQSSWKIKILSKQVIPEASKSWLSLHASLQLYAKIFYKYIGYYEIDQNNNNITWNIRKQAVGYIMLLKGKQSAKEKGKRMYRGSLLSKIQPQIGIKFTHHNIMFSHRFLCDEIIGL